MKKADTLKVLKRMLRRIEVLRREYGVGGHSGPHYVGERSPEWEVECFEYGQALQDVEQLILTELIKCDTI